MLDKYTEIWTPKNKYCSLYIFLINLCKTGIPLNLANMLSLYNPIGRTHWLINQLFFQLYFILSPYHSTFGIKVRIQCSVGTIIRNWGITFPCVVLYPFHKYSKQRFAKKNMTKVFHSCFKLKSPGTWIT